MAKFERAIPLYALPLPNLYEMVRIERDRLGLTKEELTPIALEFYGGEIPDPTTPHDLIRLAYFLRWQCPSPQSPME